MANTEPTYFTYTYGTLSKLSGISESALYQQKSRKSLDPNSLESVVLWLAANGSDTLREKMFLAFRVERRLPPTRSKKKAVKKKS